MSHISLSKHLYTNSSMLSQHDVKMKFDHKTTTVATDRDPSSEYTYYHTFYKVMSFFDLTQWYNFFTFTQDRDFIEVNESLLSLTKTVANTTASHQRDILKNELHDEGAAHAKILRHNLTILDARFQKANQKNPLTTLILTVINTVLGFLGSKSITLKTFERIDLNAWDKFIEESLNLTNDDLTKCHYSITTVNCPVEWTDATFRKLERGLLEEIKFEWSGDKFAIKFDQKEQKFTLQMLEIPATRIQQKHIVKKENPSNVEIEFTLSVPPSNSWWASLCASNEFDSVPLVLEPNCPYSLPGESGKPSLDFTFKKR